MEHGMAFHLQLLGVHFIFHKQAKHGCYHNVFLHSLLTLRCACLTSKAVQNHLRSHPWSVSANLLASLQCRRHS